MRIAKIVAPIVGVLLFAAPAFVNAQTADDIRAQIQSLLSQITALQTQLSNLTSNTPTTISTSSNSCPNLYRALSRGSRGSDVISLQQFLIAQGLLSSDSATGFFGSMTEAAAQRWQAQNSVVSYGDANTTGYGVIGARTRVAIAARCGTRPPVVQSCPQYQIPICSSGQHVQRGATDANGCQGAPMCVNDTVTQSCPLYQIPICAAGQHVENGTTDSNGCTGAPRCVNNPVVNGTASVSITAPSTFQKGNSTAISWQVNNIPSGSSLGLFLVHNTSQQDAWKLPGVTGPLTLKAQNVSGTMSGTTRWDGNSVGCAPTDFPMFCTGVEPGEYRIDAAIYDQSDSALVSGFPIPGYKGPNVVVKGSSAPFTISGSYNLDPLKGRLLGAAANKVKEAMSAYGYAGTQIEQYVKMRGDLSGPNASGNYCATFDVQPPMTGVLTACGSLSYDTPTVTGDVQVASNTLTYADAEKKAHAVADPPYLSRVRFDHQPSMSEAGYTDYSVNFQTWSDAHPDATTYLSSGVTNWTYRSDGGYWAFIIFEIKAGGSENGSDRFADNVLVRVNNSGNACVIKTAPYSGGNLGVDIFTDTISCP